MSEMFSKVRLLRLITGEEIVAEVNEDIDESKFCLFKVARVMLSPSGVALIPYLSPLSQEIDNFKEFNLKIKKEYVILNMTPRNELYNAWDQEFGSGIIRTSQSLILN